MEVIMTDIEVDEKAIQQKIENLIDDQLMLEIHDLFAKYCDPYVPYLNGPLSKTNEVTPMYVRYVQPYAHYQYMGTEFNHTLDYHPQATALWDKVMMSEQGEAFVKDVTDIFKRRARELYG